MYYQNCFGYYFFSTRNANTSLTTHNDGCYILVDSIILESLVLLFPLGTVLLISLVSEDKGSVALTLLQTSECSFLLTTSVLLLPLCSGTVVVVFSFVSLEISFVEGGFRELAALCGFCFISSVFL